MLGASSLVPTLNSSKEAKLSSTVSSTYALAVQTSALKPIRVKIQEYM